MYEGMIAENMSITGHNGDIIESYLARPLGPGPFPAVVVFHHMPGWDEGSKEIVRRLASNNYVTICPNLHHREGPGDMEEIVKKVWEAGGTPDDQFLGDLEGAIKYLESTPTHNGKIGVIGYCSGGRQAYIAACRNKKVNAAVDCYGGRVVVEPDALTERHPVAPIDMTKDMNCPLLGLFGKDDQNPSPEHVTRIEEELKKHNKTYLFKSFDGAGHSFFTAESPAYRQDAARSGWRKIFQFYEEYLQ